MALLLQPSEDHIIVFADGACGAHFSHNVGMLDDIRPSAIRYGRFRYTGECVAISQVALDFAVTRLHDQPTPVDHEGTFRLPILPDTCLQFDENLFKFTIPRPVTWSNEIRVSDVVFWWKDVFFELRNPLPFPGEPTSYNLVYRGTRYVKYFHVMIIFHV